MSSPQKSWREFAKTLAEHPSTRDVRPVILESWRRSRAAGVRRHNEKPLLHRISAADFDYQLEKNRELIQLGGPLLQEFSAAQQIRHVLYITDRDGIVLYSVGDDIWRAMFGLMPGFDWSENTMGTNGAGTALATNQPVAVVGPDHFVSAFETTTCLACPICTANGTLVGAVDFSTSVEDARVEQLSEIIELAHRIEHALHAKGSNAGFRTPFDVVE